MLFLLFYRTLVIQLKMFEEKSQSDTFPKRTCSPAFVNWSRGVVGSDACWWCGSAAFTSFPVTEFSMCN